MNGIRKEQNNLDSDLDYIMTQQQHLHNTILAMEAEILPAYRNRELNLQDQEREKGYKKAEDINSELDSIMTKLKLLVSKYNGTQSEDDGDEIAQLTKVLSKHLDILNKIDKSADQIEHRLKELGTQLGGSKRTM